MTLGVNETGEENKNITRPWSPDFSLSLLLTKISDRVCDKVPALLMAYIQAALYDPPPAPSTPPTPPPMAENKRRHGDKFPAGAPPLFIFHVSAGESSTTVIAPHRYRLPRFCCLYFFSCLVLLSSPSCFLDVCFAALIDSDAAPTV